MAENCSNVVYHRPGRADRNESPEKGNQQTPFGGPPYLQKGLTGVGVFSAIGQSIPRTFKNLPFLYIFTTISDLHILNVFTQYMAVGGP